MEFKVGDRVAVYGAAERNGEKHYYLRGFKGRVCSVFSGDEINVLLDEKAGYAGSEEFVTVHPKQCRKLKPKPCKTCGKL